MHLRSAKDLGVAVRAARKEAGLTQAELAQACRCGTRFISDLENGKPTIEFAKALHVVNALSMDLDIVKRGA